MLACWLHLNFPFEFIYLYIGAGFLVLRVGFELDWAGFPSERVTVGGGDGFGTGLAASFFGVSSVCDEESSELDVWGLRPSAGRDATSAPSRKCAILHADQWKVSNLGLLSLYNPILTSTCDLDGLE